VIGQTSGTYAFTVDAGTRQDMAVDVTFNSVASVLHGFSVNLEKKNPDGSWSPVNSEGSSQLLNLLGGGTAHISIPDIEAGDYRLKITNPSVVSALGSVSADITFVTEHLDQAAGTVPASGNIFDDNGSGADTLPPGSTLSVFDADGNEIQVSGPTVINGEYGVLTIGADGSFSYQPNLDAGSIGQSESFTYKVVSQTGAVDTATLTINIENAEELGQNRLAGMPEQIEADPHAANDNGPLDLLDDPDDELDALVSGFGKTAGADQETGKFQPATSHEDLTDDYLNSTFADGSKDDLAHHDTPLI